MKDSPPKTSADASNPGPASLELAGQGPAGAEPATNPGAVPALVDLSHLGWTTERCAAALAVAGPNNRRVAAAAECLTLDEPAAAFAAWCDGLVPLTSGADITTAPAPAPAPAFVATAITQQAGMTGSMSGFDELEKLDLVGMADTIASGALSAREATAWSLQRLQTRGRQLNAVFRIDAESALARAAELDAQQALTGRTSGPLHGVPLAHKDLFAVAGRESHAGSLILCGQIAPRTAWAVQQLDAAGQVNLGALHMAEFALSPTGYNGHYGHGLNPWNPAHVCGGSSSGSGIAVAARLVFGSLGTDTGGSIRHPAAMCGITGIKPTWRRVSVAGVLPLSPSLDCPGPLAQSARDCARLLTLIARPNAADGLCTALPAEDYEAALRGAQGGDLRGLRIGVPQAYYRDDWSPDFATDVAPALQASLDVLRGRGATLVAVGTPDMALLNALAQLVMSVEAAALHSHWIAARPQDYAAQVLRRIDPGFAYPAVRYAQALALRTRLTQNWVDTCLANCDVVHLPTAPLPTPTIAATTEGDAAAVLQLIGRVTHATRAINYLGLPAVSVPAGFSSGGLPLAFQLVGRPFAEARLLHTADAYQRDTDWHRRRPPSQ